MDRRLSRPSLSSHKTGILFVLMAALASLAYLGLNTVHLEGQGLYFDEVFQAIGSFAYIGRAPQRFAALEIQNIPLMNMNYIGAIKTAIYGLYLRLSGASFSVTNWRMVGILCVSLSLFLFGILTRKKLSLPALLCFYLLLISDITVLLTTRFDWGPVALSLSFRILMIAVWLNGEYSVRFSSLNTFFIGVLLGISIFEKLSGVVLILPALLMVFSSPLRWNKKHVSLFVLGGLVGAIPLILANLISYTKYHQLISFQNREIYSFTERTLPDFFRFLGKYFSLGVGDRVADFILGTHQGTPAGLETALLLLLLAAIVLAGLRRLERKLRLPVVMLLSYAFVAIGLYFLPAETWVHHWVIGTPFQYAAVALLIPALQEADYSHERPLLRSFFLVILALYGGSRLYGLVSLEQAYLRGDASTTWSPSLTRLGIFAAEKSEDALFIAGDWGVSNQMISFLNGQPKIVYQVPWDSGSIDTIIKIVKRKRPKEIYFIFINPPHFTKPEERVAVLAEVTKRLAPRWQETLLDPEVDDLQSLIVVRLVRQ